ncbi:MAG: hypothetical protein EXR27_01040 [Betaproteobacteria bacterium]|nr:hypothetical protein [Betaproteobacteria bacterium]
MAQTGNTGYPAKPVRLVVPFAAGGNTDLIARIVAQKFSESLGAPWLVENRAGAGATLGADFVAKAAPDGYTLLVSNNLAMATGPLVYPRIGYHPIA